MFKFWICLVFSVLPAMAGADLNDKYPVRYIDRPYTLPVGVHELEIFGSATGPFNGQSSDYYFLSLNYRQALSDDYTLDWLPLPLGVEYQPLHSDDEKLGVSWALLFAYNNAQVSAEPTFRSFYLIRMKPNVGWETRLYYFWDFPFGEDLNSWSAGLNSGPVFQASDRVALAPRIGTDLKNFVLRKLIEGSNPALPSPSLTYFFGGRAQIAIGRIFEVTAEAKYDGFNFAGIYDPFFEFDLTLAKYW